MGTRDPRIDADIAKAAPAQEEQETLATYEAFPPSHKREYVEWVTEAKSEATRERRLAVAWIAEGKPRNWKYMK